MHKEEKFIERRLANKSCHVVSCYHVNGRDIYGSDQGRRSLKGVKENLESFGTNYLKGS